MAVPEKVCCIGFNVAFKLDTAGVKGRSQDFTLGATEAERRRYENRGAEGWEL